MGMETDYLFEEIESLSLRSTSDNSFKFSVLYHATFDYLKAGMYQKCINAVKEYVQLESEITVNGYYLMGRAYEELNQLDFALCCYKYVLERSHLADAYRRLGGVYCKIGNYNEALKYHLEYQKRKPLYCNKSLYDLIEVYKKLGDREKVYEYKTLLMRVKNKENRRK